MNPKIKQHFESLELQFIESPIVTRYEIVRQEISETDAKFRVKAELLDGGLLELFEYVTTLSGTLILLKYSFHWQDRQGRLQRRWDNAPHHPDLPGSPHHIHLDDVTVQGIQTVPKFFDILQQNIEAIFNKTT